MSPILADVEASVRLMSATGETRNGLDCKTRRLVTLSQGATLQLA